MTAPLSPTRYLGPAFQLVHGPVRVATSSTVDVVPLDDEWVAQAAFHEVTGPSTPASARVVVPLYPPSLWLSDDAADIAEPHLTIYPTGRVAGVVAPQGRCLLDGSQRGECWTVPRPVDGRGSTLAGGPGEEYQMARGAGVMHLADGTVIAAAPLPGEGGHANAWATPENAADHYANTANQVARGRYVWSDTAGGGVGGIVFVGALVPTITEPRLIVARGSASSIDFRWIDDEDRYRLVGCCNVNIGGLPSKYRAAVMAGASFLLPIDTDSDPQLQEDPAMGTTIAPCTCGGTTTISESATGVNPDQWIHLNGQPPYGMSVNVTPKQAAYRLEPIESNEPTDGAQITWDGGIGMYAGTVDLIADGELWLVYPEVDGELAIGEDRIAVPVGAATLTGLRYEWEQNDADEDRQVVRAGALGDMPTPMDPEVSARLDALDGNVQEILRLIADVHGALVAEATKGKPIT